MESEISITTMAQMRKSEFEQGESKGHMRELGVVQSWNLMTNIIHIAHIKHLMEFRRRKLQNQFSVEK